MRIEEIERYGLQALQATLAGIDQVDEARKIPLLRNAIELALERVAAAEAHYYAFLGECALLASQNMQDVRLHDIERRLARIENPDAPGLGEILVETAIILGVELAVVLGAPLLAGPALIFVSSRVLARSSRITAAGTRRISRLRKNGPFEALSAAESDLVGARLAYGEAKREFRKAALSGGEIGPSTKAVLDAGRAKRDAERAVELAGIALKDFDDSANALARAYNDALAGKVARINSKPLQTFLKGAAGHTVQTRLGESTGGYLADLIDRAMSPPERAAAGTPESPFLSSTVVGQIVSRLRELGFEATQGHNFSRVLLRAVDDASFADNAVVQEIARGLFDAMAPLENAMALAEVVRPLAVRGYEALLWYEWLAITGALRIEEGATFTSPVKLEPGDLYEGYVMTEQTSADPAIVPGELGGLGMAAAVVSLFSHAYVNEGTYYHGVRKISEHQAKYLYDTFGAPYFAIPENASLVPFRDPYDPDRYTEVLDAAKRSQRPGLDNWERTRRLDEMRVLVVIFFTRFLQSARAKAGYGAVSDDPILIDDYLSQLPKYAPMLGSDTCEPSALDFQATVHGLLADAGVTGRMETGVALRVLDDSMTRLELAIWQYAQFRSQSSYEPGDAPDGQSATDAAFEIVDLQRALEKDYATMLDVLKLIYPAAVTEFRARYEERKSKLMSFDPDTAAGTGWHYPEPEPVETP
jgi:hypothetical protein